MYNVTKNSILVSLMVCGSLVILIYLIIVLGRIKFGDDSFFIDVQFTFLDTLEPKASVSINGGYIIGYVSEIYEHDLKVYARLSIDNQYKNKIPNHENTQITIFSQGFIGAKYVNIILPEVDKYYDIFYQNGDLVRGIDPASFDQMMYAFSQWFNNKNGGQIIAEIMSETQRFVNLLNQILLENRTDLRFIIRNARVSFASISKNLDVLIVNLNSLSKDLASLSSNHKQDLSILVSNIAKISEDLQGLTERINYGKGSIGKLIYDDSLYHNANQTLENAKELMEILKQQPWLLLYKQ